MNTRNGNGNAGDILLLLLTRVHWWLPGLLHGFMPLLGRQRLYTSDCNDAARELHVSKVPFWLFYGFHRHLCPEGKLPLLRERNRVPGRSQHDISRTMSILVGDWILLGRSYLA